VGLKPPKEIPRAVVSLEPMQLFALDYAGPITPISQSGARYILIGADYFSQYVFAHSTTTATARVSAHFLWHNVGNHFGSPQYLYTDNGSHFTGEDFTSYLKEKGIRHITAPVTAPWSVGFIERIVRMVVGQL
jgi:transposase InsO family protein